VVFDDTHRPIETHFALDLHLLTPRPVTAR
jgi:hypothetical protein